MTSVATAPVASPPPYNPQYAAAPPMDAAAWQQQQQQFLQWQQFQQWQQQQQSASSYPMTQPINTGASVPPANVAMPSFSGALTQPVPYNVAPSGVNDKEANTAASASATNPTTAANPATTSANASPTSSSGGGNVFDQLSALLSALSSGLNSVNSNGSSLWKSVATTGQQMQPLMKLCKSCASS